MPDGENMSRKSWYSEGTTFQSSSCSAIESEVVEDVGVDVETEAAKEDSTSAPAATQSCSKIFLNDLASRSCMEQRGVALFSVDIVNRTKED